jgi:hypothetical protein
VDHIDGNPNDCRLANLRYVPSRAGPRKLTAEDVLEIRRQVGGVRRLRRGEGARLSQRYGVTAVTISDIVHRRTWRHL